MSFEIKPYKEKIFEGLFCFITLSYMLVIIMMTRFALRCDCCQNQ